MCSEYVLQNFSNISEVFVTDFRGYAQTFSDVLKCPVIKIVDLILNAAEKKHVQMNINGVFIMLLYRFSKYIGFFNYEN